MLKGAITIDLDTLSVHLKGHGLKRKQYDFLDFKLGMENLLKFFDEFGIKTTLFVIGKDLIPAQNTEAILKAVEKGHEIANHSMNHVQGFRLLNKQEKEKELQQAEKIIIEKTKIKPVGFRAPGWNINDEMVEILKKNDYLYDSSIFPSFLNIPLKVLHYLTMSSRPFPDRTTLGSLKYSLSSPFPHKVSKNSLSKKGQQPLIEFPVSVTPIIRLPFFATFQLKTGLNLFKFSYQLMKTWQRPIIYEFHLFDFVDFDLPGFADQIPKKTDKGIYLPQSIHTSFKDKWTLFHEVLSTMTQDYKFDTLENLAKEYLNKK